MMVTTNTHLVYEKISVVACRYYHSEMSIDNRSGSNLHTKKHFVLTLSLSEFQQVEAGPPFNDALEGVSQSCWPIRGKSEIVSFSHTHSSTKQEQIKTKPTGQSFILEITAKLMKKTKQCNDTLISQSFTYVTQHAFCLFNLCSLLFSMLIDDQESLAFV